MTITNQPSYPECCPQCHEAAGWPYAAGTCERPGVIIVKLRCQKCSCEWSSEAPKAPIVQVSTWPRPDRRTTRQPQPNGVTTRR